MRKPRGDSNSKRKNSRSPGTPPELRPGKKSFSIVGIGASAGGLEAFTQLLRALPANTGMGFVLVQHLDPAHESALPRLLAKTSSMPVSEVSNEMPVEPNHVYVIPPNANLAIAHGVLKLHPRGQTSGAHRSIDSFLQSLADDQHEAAIGVILSGTASDGTLGLETIKAEGGITFAQDEKSAKYDSMPRSAVAAGCVDFVLSPENIAKELARIARHPHIAKVSGEDSRTYAGDEASRGVASADAKHFRRILTLVWNHSSVDFSLYKFATIERRIIRRMVLNKLDTVGAYSVFLSGNAAELDALYSDLLIHVTSFFRNPEAFEILKHKVFPQIIKRGNDPARVWVLGCSTGQEAYSIAMSFAEFSQRAAGRVPQLQIFATDVNDALLDKARFGLYAKSLVHDVSPERLGHFFMEEDGGYRISKPIRQMCVFARQNFISDPPFSRMDLVSCRNLLIYIEPTVQKKILPRFHYSLKADGFLFLGASESIGEFANLFAPVDKKHKIYSKKSGPTPSLHAQFAPWHPDANTQIPRARPGTPREVFDAEHSAQLEADRITLTRHAPPGVLINAQMEVLQFRGATHLYLEPPTCKASFDLLKMVRGGLMLPLRAAINKAKKEGKVVRRENLRVDHNGGSRMVNFEVTPLKNLKERCYLILFEDATPTTAGRESSRTAISVPQKSRGSTQSRAAETKKGSARIAELERELTETRDYLQAVLEQSEAANEELQASNEEVQSANEELQSINEELETSKEELESTNEELTTVNDEMASRNAELNVLNSDLNNLYLSVQMPVLLLGQDLSIRRFTPPAGQIFNLLTGDVGRPLSGIKHNLLFPELETFLSEVIQTLTVREREVQNKDGHWYWLRARPYLTFANKFDGVVVVLVDINALKRSQRQITDARDYASAIVESVPPLLVLDQNLRVITANESFYDHFRVSRAETEKRLVYELGNSQWNIPRLRTFLEDILARNNTFKEFEVTHEFAGIGRRTVLLSGRRIDGLHRVLLAIDDITERKRAEQALRASESRLAGIINSAMDTIITIDADQRIVLFNAAAEEMFRCSATQAVGQPIDRFIPERFRAAHGAHVRKFGESGVTTRQMGALGLLYGLRFDGEEFPIEASISKFSEGSQFSFSVILRDITERKRVEQALQESGERFRFLAESMPPKIFTAKPDGEIDYRNRQWSDFTGLALEDIKGPAWTSLIHPEDVEEYIRRWRHSVTTGMPFELEHRLRRADGVYRWHLTRAHALRDAEGKVQMWVGSTTDIEDQKQAEEHLEAIVTERTRALQEAVGELEALSYSISHDLRAPLRAMHGFAQMLLQENAGQLDLQGLTYLQRISSSAARLDRLIQDVLSYTRVLRAEAPLTRIGLDELVREIIGLNHDWQSPQAEIQIAGPLPPVLANTAFLTQCISNLLDNAVKFTLPGTTPRIKVWAEPIKADVRLWFEDHGIGIARENHDRIFRMFEQINPAAEFGGTGIGLTIVRKAIERMGGRVGFESEPGKGSKFWIELRQSEKA